MSSHNSRRSYGHRSSRQGANYYPPGGDGFESDPRPHMSSSQTPRITQGYETAQGYPNPAYSRYPPSETVYEHASQQVRPRPNTQNSNYTTASHGGRSQYPPRALASGYQQGEQPSVGYTTYQDETQFPGPSRQDPRRGRRVSHPSTATSGPPLTHELEITLDPSMFEPQPITAANASNSGLDPRYTLQPRGFFTPGRVFAILWHETAGPHARSTQTVASQAIYPGRWGENVFSTIRRMVVVKVYNQCAWCFPIYTYGGRGVSKHSANADKHSIVYIEGTRPMAAPGEPRMSKSPLEIRPHSLDQRLDSMSRLNFSKLFTVEYNVKVLPLGKVTENSMPEFMNNARRELSLPYP